MHEQPSAEHFWLQRLVGEWRFESECHMGPDQPPIKTTGHESVKSLGGLWTIGEGTMGNEPEQGKSIMTLGYDPVKKRFVGTFIASMMTHLWPYAGSLDAEGRKLILDSEGPSFASEGEFAHYQDAIEFVDDDHRILTSRLRLPNGEWLPFMEAHYDRLG